MTVSDEFIDSPEILANIEASLRKDIPEDSHPRAATSGVLAGPQITQRVIARYAHNAGFRDLDLFIACMVCGAESWRFLRAHNDNFEAGGVTIKSRDVGLMQINIPAADFGTSKEEALYDPFVNFARAFELWKNRKWQPWVAYNSGVYLHDTYLQWALLGVANHTRESFMDDQANAGYESKTRMPWISLHDLHKLYPDVVLG